MIRQAMAVAAVWVVLSGVRVEAVHQWGLFEAALESAVAPSAAPEAVEVSVRFSGPGGETVERLAFWDGGTTWRVRFAPESVGEWSWVSRCGSDASLDGQRGAFACTAYRGDNPFYRHGPLRVSADGRHFVHRDGTPFFWLVDTAWNGALKSAAEDWQAYLADRAGKRFTGIQYVVTHWRAAAHNAEGLAAFTGDDRIRIQPEFFRRIDARTQAVNDRGLLAVPVLLWTLGDREQSPGQLPEDQAILLARYLSARLGAWHVAWFLAGDGDYGGGNAERWQRIGRAVFAEPGHAPATLHPCGMNWPWEPFRREPWLDFLGYQSGHGDDDNTLRWIFDGPPARQWMQEPVRPVINLEPPYEDHVAYQSRQPHTAYSVRRAVYWSLLSAPVAGTSYGAHGVWSWEETPAVPRDHGGSGVARPWREAMALPGSSGMRHLADLFTALPWWTLAPDPALLAESARPAAAPGRTHVAYTRARDGRAAFYLDGREQRHGPVEGEFSNWDAGHRLCLANELTGDRPWLGALHQVALYDRALGAAEIAGRFAAGPEAPPADPLALYAFKEGGGHTVGDTAGRGTPVDLTIDDEGAVAWLAGGGLEVRGNVRIASAGPAGSVSEALMRSGAVTVEAWITPAHLEQAGPARIVSLSQDTANRNLTLGQDGAAYVVRCRTTRTSENGLPALATVGPDDPGRHVAAARSPDGNLAVLYAPVGGEIALAPGRLRDGLSARWINPRTGEPQPARAAGPGTYLAPDTNDWVLVIQADSPGE